MGNDGKYCTDCGTKKKSKGENLGEKSYWPALGENFGNLVIVAYDREPNYLLEHLGSSYDFNWGYTGSGPTDLATSMLADALDEVDKVETYRMGQEKPLSLKWDDDFLHEHIANIDMEDNKWEIYAKDIIKWLDDKERKQKTPKWA